MKYKVWVLVLVFIAIVCFIGLALLMCTNFFPWDARVAESSVLSGTGLFSLFLVTYLMSDVIPITRHNADTYSKMVILRSMENKKFLVTKDSKLNFTENPEEATRYKREAAPTFLPGVPGRIVSVPVDN